MIGYHIFIVLYSLSGLQNDHKAAMNEIEKALHTLHARESNKVSPKDIGNTTIESHSWRQKTLNRPFAKVDAITPGSPAEEAVILIFMCLKCIRWYFSILNFMCRTCFFTETAYSFKCRQIIGSSSRRSDCGIWFCKCKQLQRFTKYCFGCTA